MVDYCGMENKYQTMMKQVRLSGCLFSIDWPVSTFEISADIKSVHDDDVILMCLIFLAE